jgi:hypothetical protein
MYKRDACVIPGLGGCRRGIGVALDQNRRGWLFCEECPKAFDHPADLGVPRLAGMQQPGLVPQHPHNGGKLTLSGRVPITTATCRQSGCDSILSR